MVRFKKKFRTPFQDYQARNGQPFKIIRKITKPEKGVDAEVLPMYLIQFPDGTVIHAYPEEVERQ